MSEQTDRIIGLYREWEHNADMQNAAGSAYEFARWLGDKLEELAGENIILRRPCDYCWKNGRCRDCEYWQPSTALANERGWCREIWPQGAYPSRCEKQKGD